MGSVSAIVPAIARDFGVSSFIAGQINWAYMLPYGLLALVYGPLTRRFNNRHIIVASLVLFSVFSLLSGLARNYPALFIFRFLVGMFAAATTPLVLIYLAGHAHETKRGKFVGLYFSATFCADLLGLFFSGFIPWRVMFFIPAVLGIATAFLSAKYFPKTWEAHEKVSSRYKEAFAQPQILRVFIYIFAISLLYHGVRQWLGVYFAEQLGMKQFFVSMTLTLASLAGIAGEVFGGFLSDKNGRVSTLKTGMFLMTASLFVLILTRSKFLVAVMVLFWGFGWAMNHAGLSTFLTDLDKRFMKEISSLNSSVRFVAGGLGVVFGGYLMRESFMAGFVIYGLCLLAMFFLTERILYVRTQR